MKKICTGHKHSRCLQTYCSHAVPHDTFRSPRGKCTKWTECEVEKDRWVKVRCTSLKDTVGKSPCDDFEPKTAMGKKLLEIRQKALEKGMKTLSEEEILTGENIET